MATRDTSMEGRRNALLEDVEQFLAARMSDYVAPAEAEVIAGDLADHLADFWGGQLINFPKDFHRRLARRDLEIFDAFTGDNLGDLARRYGISERGLRKLIHRVRARLLDAGDDRTLDMFNE